MKKDIVTLAAALCCALAGSAFAADNATGMDKAAYKSEKDQISSTYKADKKACDPMKGNAKDICVAEAKAARIKTEEEAEAAYEGTPKARSRATSAIAEANYKVARARCDERTGNDKDVCIKVAKAGLTKAKADANANRKTVEAHQDAAKEKREAEYKVAAQKCEALNGDAKSACVKEAKARYGM